MDSLYESRSATDFAERVQGADDVIVCGSGSSGSVVARQLADNPDVSVLLLEAGGGDDIPEVMEAGKWLMNLGSERDWSFQGQPNVNLNGRSVHLAMGKVLSGGSSINVMAWARPQERLGLHRITSCRESRHIPKGPPRADGPST
jgi:choline dehydrogenase